MAIPHINKNEKEKEREKEAPELSELQQIIKPAQC